MEDKIVFKDGSNAYIESVFQTKTYAGLIEGFPLRVFNNQKIRLNENRAKELFSIDSVITIPPKITEIETDHFKNNFPESIPIITCFLLLKSFDVYKDKSKDFSYLGVVFYQDDFLFPIEEEILEKISNLNFKEICEEFDL